MRNVRALPVIIFALALSACASAPKVAYQTLAATAQSLETSRATFVDYDRLHQSEIVSAAKKAGKDPAPELYAYREKRKKVVEAFDYAKAVVLSGKAVMPLVESGVAKSKDVDIWIKQLLEAANQVRAALAAVGVGQ